MFEGTCLRDNVFEVNVIEIILFEGQFVRGPLCSRNVLFQLQFVRDLDLTLSERTIFKKSTDYDEGQRASHYASFPRLLKF
jgi:hypothetical protein